MNLYKWNTYSHAKQKLNKLLNMPVFHEVKNSHIALIERFLSNKEGKYGETLSKILYWELRELLQYLLEEGFTDLCVKYVKLGTRKTYIQRPQPVQRTALIKSVTIAAGNNSDNQIIQASFGVADPQKTIWAPLTKEEVEIARQNQQNDLVTFTSDMEYVNETYIDTYMFAPSFDEAENAGTALWKSKTCDPAVIWHYFEHALRCWNTSEFYWYEIIKPQCVDHHDKHFEAGWHMTVWREIADIKNRKCSSKRIKPTIFTEDFFKSGLKTLTNSIGMHLSGYEKKELINQSSTFELALNRNELWVYVTFENQSVKKFFIQKFNENAEEGSYLYRFAKEIFKFPAPGDKKAQLIRKWETASKHIRRLHIPETLKCLFFTKIHGSCFHFSGTRLVLKNKELPDLHVVLEELQKRHLIKK